MRPKPRKPGQSIKDYRAMVKRMEERFSGRGSTIEERLSGRGSTPMPKHSQSDPKYNPLAGKKVTPELKAQIDKQIKLRKKYEEYAKKFKKFPPLLENSTLTPKYTANAEKRILALVEEYKKKPKKFATPLQNITPKQKAEILKQRKIRNKEYLALTPAERKGKLKEAQEARRRFEKQNRPPHAYVFPRSNPQSFKPVIPIPPRSNPKPSIARPPKKASTLPTSSFGSVARGPKKYNQAAYLSGLNTPSNTKKQSIYKPYAKGGGIRKPKYKD